MTLNPRSQTKSNQINHGQRCHEVTMQGLLDISNVTVSFLKTIGESPSDVVLVVLEVL